LAVRSNDTRKAILAQYKEREITGGVYLVRNTLTDKVLLDAATDMQSIKNRYEFALKTGSCINPKLQKDWSEHGNGVFAFEVLEEIKKGESQTDAEFRADVDLLKEMWLEKLSNGNLY